eukprot:gnl/MRDRNA2_/MRDRNA2_47085_c0_seq1.p1 gnl/MRDRNA2_/MRDRNA2_47085_c0~~gnl/MRDRNA2_/MRDRNA2_47085_c0_seq1.p1  ORF type:complete len:371 (+),score=90.32 gnl/MRDRNA2_/MRDRNA2_47085_c0_seq1:196-1308(+)
MKKKAEPRSQAIAKAAFPALASAKTSFKAYLIIFNIFNKFNIGQLIRSAMAFNVTEIAVVGARTGGRETERAKKFKKLSDLQVTGNQGAALYADFRYFDSLAAAKDYFCTLGVDVCGIEIVNESAAVYDIQHASKGLASPWPFRRSTAFMLGNEGSGLSSQQLAICDYLVYIPQHSLAMASLNVAHAGSIVLHHFALFAGFEEAPRNKDSFATIKPRSRRDRWQNPTDVEVAEIERKREARARQKTHLATARAEVGAATAAVTKRLATAVASSMAAAAAAKGGEAEAVVEAVRNQAAAVAVSHAEIEAAAKKIVAATTEAQADGEVGMELVVDVVRAVTEAVAATAETQIEAAVTAGIEEAAKAGRPEKE